MHRVVVARCAVSRPGDQSGCATEHGSALIDVTLGHHRPAVVEFHEIVRPVRHGPGPVRDLPTDPSARCRLHDLCSGRPSAPAAPAATAKSCAGDGVRGIAEPPARSAFGAQVSHRIKVGDEIVEPGCRRVDLHLVFHPRLGSLARRRLHMVILADIDAAFQG